MVGRFLGHRLDASMRPPEFTGGNRLLQLAIPAATGASMRPPEFTGGNIRQRLKSRPHTSRFNEAAGIHRRKPSRGAPRSCIRGRGFNEAAGIHRRKPRPLAITAPHRFPASMRPPEFTGGNKNIILFFITFIHSASMRPPEFTGGNPVAAVSSSERWKLQ